MFHCSPDVLSQREQQGEGKATRENGGIGTSTARGRSTCSSCSASSASPAPLRRTLITSRTPSSSSSREKSPSPSRRLQQQSEQCRPPSSPQTRPIRSANRSGQGLSLQWPCTSSQVPSQLLGGRPGTDADISSQSVSDSALWCDRLSTVKYHSVQAASAEEQLQALVAPRTQILQSSTPSQLSTSLPSTPKSGGSTSPSSPSNHSVLSYASSFVDRLRTTRKDYRLLKKNSRPSQHLSRTASKLEKRPTPAAKSPSYYRPRVIEDTADVLNQPASATGPSEPPSVLLSPPFGAKRKLSTSIHEPESHEFQTSPTKPLLRASTWQTLSPVRRKKQSSSTSPDRSKSSLRDQRESETSYHTSLKIPKHLFNDSRHFHVVTPPEIEPGTPGHSPFRSGDSYFRTFRQDTIDQKIAAATPMSSASLVTATQITPRTPPPPPTSSTQSITPRPAMFTRHRSRRGSSLVRPHSRKASTPSTQVSSLTPGSALNSPPSTPTPVRRAPAVTFSMPSTACFAKSRRINRSSEGSPASPILAATSSIAEIQHEDDSSESVTVDHMRPCHIAKRPRLKRRDTAERLPDLRSLAKDIDSGEHPTAAHPDSHTHPGISWAPALIKRISTELKDDAPKAPRSRPSVPFKGLFFDATSMPSASDQKSAKPQASNSSLCKIDKRESMLSLVLQSMDSRRSINKLQRKSSHPAVRRSSSSIAQHLSMQERASDVTATVRSIRPCDLEVRNFYTTPFPQRERDAILAERVQVRALIEECLNDPNDHNTILGHEVDVPDHLPTSPLCPLSVKHKSGGKAICPLHRRRRRSGAVKRASTVKPSLLTNRPTIVYESGMDGKTRDP